MASLASGFATRPGASSARACPVFLEADNDASWDLATGTGGGNAFGKKVADKSNRCLAALLARPFPAFLGALRADDALGRSAVKFLDSFLRHRSRDVDGVWTGAEGAAETVIVDSQKEMALRRLDRRVLSMYHRLATRDEGRVSVQAASAAASGKDYAQVLYDECLIDVPKMLDLCALYGRQHTEHVRVILVEAFALQPAYYDDLAQAMGYSAKALAKANGFIGGFACGVDGNSSSVGSAQSESKDDLTTSVSPEQRHRAAVCDVLKYAVDILNTMLVLASTVPEIFARGLRDPSEIIEALAPFASATLRNAEKALESAGGVSDVETNAIHLLRSLAIRVGYAVLNHRLLTPMEGFMASKKKEANDDANGNALPGLARGESKHPKGSSANCVTSIIPEWTLDGLRGDIFGALHPLAFRDDMESIRTALQMHYNVAARLLALIDAGVIERDSATTEATAKILEAAPIPADIMAPDETTDVGAAVSKNAGAARKTTISAKMRRKQRGAAALAVGGGNQFVEMTGAIFSETDQKLREAMRAIVSRYDSYEADEIDADDTLDGPMLRILSGDSRSYSGDEYDEESTDGKFGREDTLLQNNELLEVRLDLNGIQTGVVRDASGKRVEVLMPNVNHKASITPASRGRRSRRGGRGGGGGRGGHSISGKSGSRMSTRGGDNKQEKKKKATGQPGGGKGNAKGTSAASERTRRRNERNKSSRANHNRKRGAQRKAAKGMF